MDMKTVHKLIKLREGVYLSQEQLAAKISVGKEEIASWEKGETSPDADNLLALAKLYGISVDELLGNKAEPAPEKAEQQAAQPAAEPTAAPVQQPEAVSQNKQEAAAGYADEKRNWAKFPYPVLMLVIFFLLGFLFNIWHVAWLVFLTIPLFYWMVGKK
jgi:transcriptional regulator with XRE-family HTH domain